MGLIEVHWTHGSEEEVLRVAARLKARGLDSAEKLTVFAEAYRYARLGSAAVPLYRRTLALDPANFGALSGLSIVLEGTPEGIRLREEFLAKYGETGRRRFFLGSSRLEAGDLRGAETEYRRALELSPDDWVTYPQLGVVLAKTGRTAEARAVWSRGLELAREMLEAAPRNDRIHCWIINLAAMLGDRETFDREERFLAASADDRRGYWLSHARALLGDDDRAVALATESLSAGALQWSFDDLEQWGLDRLAQHPGSPELLARHNKAQDDLLARYPID